MNQTNRRNLYHAANLKHIWIPEATYLGQGLGRLRFYKKKHDIDLDFKTGMHFI